MQLRFLLFVFLSFSCYVSFSQVTARFVLKDSIGCAPFQAEITNTSTYDGDVTFDWDFGAGSAHSNNSDEELSFYYKDPGTYTITLVVEQGTEKSVYTQNVIVFASPKAEVVLPDLICPEVEFNAMSNVIESSADIAELSWSFGDGKTLVGDTVAKLYNNAGTYNLYHKVEDVNGCSVELTENIHVIAPPAATFELEREFACELRNFKVFATNTTVSDLPNTFCWEYEGAKVKCNETVFKSKPWMGEGEKDVSLIVNYGSGCLATMTKTLKVGSIEARFEVYNGRVANPNNLVAEGDTADAGYVLLKNTTVGANDSKWIYNGQEYITNEQDFFLCERGEHEITLIVGIESACSDTLVASVVVGDPKKGIVASQKGKTIRDGNLCYGETKLFNPAESSTVTWKLGESSEVADTYITTVCGEQQFELIAVSEIMGCTLEYKQDFTVKNCNDFDLNISSVTTLSKIDTVGLNCTGNYSFSVDGIDSPTIIFAKDTFHVDSVIPVCTEGQYNPLVIGTFPNGCYDTVSVSFKVEKCELPWFDMVTADGTNLGDGEHVCYGELIDLMPEDKISKILIGNVWKSFPEADTIPYYARGEEEETVNLDVVMKNGCRDTASRLLFVEKVTAAFEYIDTTLGCPLPLGAKMIWNGKNAETFEWKLVKYESGKEFSKIISTENVAEFVDETDFLQTIKEHPREPVYHYYHLRNKVAGAGPLFCADSIDELLFKAVPQAWIDYAPPYNNMNTTNKDNEQFGCDSIDVELHGSFYPVYNSFDTLVHVYETTAKQDVRFGVRLTDDGQLVTDWISGIEPQFGFQTISFPDYPQYPTLRYIPRKQAVKTNSWNDVGKTAYVNDFNLYNGKDTVLIFWGDYSGNCKGSVFSDSQVNEECIFFRGATVENVGKMPPVLPAGTRVVITDTIIKPKMKDIVQLEWDYGDGIVEAFSVSPATYRTKLEEEALELATSEAERGIIRDLFYYYPYTEAFRKLHRVLNIEEREIVKYTASKEVGLVKIHSFVGQGKYRPKLSAVDEAGCIGGHYAFSDVEIGRKVKVSYEFSPDTICPGDVVEFVGINNDTVKIDHWHFQSVEGGLNSSCAADSIQSMFVNPSATGEVQVKMTAGYNNCYTDVLAKDTLVVKGAVSEFTYDMDCESPLEYEFTSKAVNADSLVWRFSGGIDSTIIDESNPVVTFPASSDVKVTLYTINKEGDCPADSTTGMVYPREIEAKIDLSDTVFCLDKSITSIPDSSKYYSESNILEPFAWDIDGKWFGRTYGGAVFKTIDSLHTITLFAQDINGCKDTAVITARLSVPEGKMRLEDDYLCAAFDTVTAIYENYDSSIVYAFVNDIPFVDVTETDTLIRHSVVLEHKNETDYKDTTFSLIIKDRWGCVDTSEYTIKQCAPKAYFSNGFAGCDNLPIWLENDDKRVDSLYWKIYNYQDGEKVVQVDSATAGFKADFILRGKGDYSVDLIATKNHCRDTMTFADGINIQTLAADVTLSDSIICDGERVHFKLTPTGDSIVEGRWAFGDGNFADYLADTVSHVFSSGEFTAILDAKTENQCWAADTLYIKVNGSSFSSTREHCLGDEVAYTYLDNMADSLIWDFGDGTSIVTEEHNVTHVYDKKGKYTITLISLMQGCNDTLVQEEYVDVENISAAISHSKGKDEICLNEDITFWQTDAEQTAKVIWYYDETNIDVNEPGIEVPIKFTSEGTHTVRLEAESKYGCKDQADTVVTVSFAEAEYTIDKREVCRLDEVNFEITSNRNMESFQWIFGDGASDDVNSKTTHRYTVKGYNPVTLLVFDSAGCKTTYDTSGVYVRQVNAYFTVNDFHFCFGVDTLRIKEKSTLADSFHWDYGDGFTLAQQTPEDYIYRKEGTYNLRLAVDSEIGCKDTFALDLQVHPSPALVVDTKDTVCVGDEITVQARSNESLTSLKWAKNGVLAGKGTYRILDTPMVNTVYSVAVVDEHGCSASAKFKTYVMNEPQNNVLFSDTTIIIGDKLKIPIETSNYSSFEWSPDHAISCLDCAEPLVNPTEYAEYHVVVKDRCFEREYDFSIDVVEMADYAVPTAFTPNGDGENDVLYVRGWAIKQLHQFDIYNRWGQLIYSSQDVEKGWDGTFNGQAQPSDSYVYIVEVENLLGETSKMKGYVSLMR